jgi:hypothetical protein
VGCMCSWEEAEPALQGPGTERLTAKTAYQIARTHAQKWRANAYVTDVAMVIPGAEIDTGPRTIHFEFIADREWGPFHWWDEAQINVDAYEGEVKVETAWGSGSRKPRHLDIESAILDSSDALQRAESPSGKAYREKYANAYVRISGERYIGDQIAWIVDYSRPEVSGTELSIAIDSATGEMLSRKRYRLPTAEPK